MINVTVKYSDGWGSNGIRDFYNDNELNNFLERLKNLHALKNRRDKLKKFLKVEIINNEPTRAIPD